MNITRTVAPLIKLCFLAAAGWGLYALWHKGVPHRVERAEQAAETEVAVHVGKISLMTLRHGVTAYGTVEPDPGVAGKAPASARITAPVAGIVAEVNCYEGQRVEKGQTLFTLDHRKLGASIDQARAVLAAAQQNVEQQEKSLRQEPVPLLLFARARQERDLAKSELDHALAQQALLKITAPLSGTVVYVNVRPGEVTDPETLLPLVELVDLSRLVVAASIPSSQMPAIRLGQMVEILPQQSGARDIVDPSETGAPTPAPAALTGTVTLIEDRVDPKTDMGPVDISLPPEARLRPGQFVRVRIITDERRDCLTVPSQSVVKNEKGDWVISLVNGKSAVQQPVTVGFREGDRVQVHALLLQAGDEVVAAGAYGLPEKTKIRRLND